MRNSKPLAILLTGALFFMLLCPVVDAASSNAAPSQPKHHCTGEQQQDNNQKSDKDQKLEECCSQNVIPVQQFHPSFACSTLSLLQSDAAVEDFASRHTVPFYTYFVLPTGKHLAELSILRI